MIFKKLCSNCKHWKILKLEEETYEFRVRHACIGLEQSNRFVFESSDPRDGANCVVWEARDDQQQK